MEKLIFTEAVTQFLLKDTANQSLDIQQIKPDTNLWKEGLIDSFRIMELVFFLEDLLQIEIDFEYSLIRNFESIDTIYDTLVSVKSN